MLPILDFCGDSKIHSILSHTLYLLLEERYIFPAQKIIIIINYYTLDIETISQIQTNRY
jgi:hypothetical protein